mmetsp:Transcript_31559/g.36034  ORF Transcript_31559/g.36034 Transcript_31559/m.36034 type:complete len:154 (+) Transcript_31559:13-474(+)
MVKGESWWNNVTDGPLLYPFYHLWQQFMNIERGSKFPFYIYPGVKVVGKKEDTVISFIDNLVDIHEVERNKHDIGKDKLERLLYVLSNIHRHQNDTVVNLMFDTKLSKPQYDKLNSAIAVRFATYMATMTAVHTLGFTYLCYFFRYRRLSVLP